MKLSIVIPVYNEQDNILRLISELDKKVKTTSQKLIIYDTPEDPTYVVVLNHKKKHHRSDIKLVRNNVGTGRGALNALLTGFKESSGDAIVVVMADLSDDLKVIDDMTKLHQQGYMVVCASRYMKGGRQIGGPWLKRTLSRLAGVSLHLIRRVPTHDISNNFRLYDRKFVQSLKIESTGGFEIAMEITVKAFKQKEKITEVPATWRDRTAGESNFKLWRWLPSYLRWYWYAIK